MSNAPVFQQCPIITHSKIHYDQQLGIEVDAPPCPTCSLGIKWVFRGKRYIKIKHITTYVAIMRIGDEIWYSEPDNTRIPWVFLSIKTQCGEIVGWHVCYGNSNRVVKVVRREGDQEQEALTGLVDEIKRCKKGTLLITYDRETLPALRRKLLKYDARVNLRGLRHVCIESLLKLYFGNTGETKGVDRDPSELWRIFTKIGPLVPEEALEGEML